MKAAQNGVHAGYLGSGVGLGEGGVSSSRRGACETAWQEDRA